MEINKSAQFGRVCVETSYVVDLDNPKMVQEAKDCLYEDIMNAMKYEAIIDWIHVVPDPAAKRSDIPDFLRG